MSIKDTLLEHGPKIALALMAARQGGPQAAAAFQQGLQEARMRKQQLERQSVADQQAADYHAARMANMQADNDRAVENAEYQRFRQAVELMDRASQQQAEIATDPVDAENALMQQASSIATGFGMEPDRLTPFVPSLAPQIAARQKKQARARYAEFLKAYGDKAAEMEGSVSDSSGAFQGMTFAQIREMGEAIAPQPVDFEARTPGSLDAHVADVFATETERLGRPLTRKERADLRLRASRDYGAAARRPPSARGGLTTAQRLSVLRDRAYTQIADRDAMDAALTDELIGAGLDPAAEERKARARYQADLARIEQSLRPRQDRYGVPEDPADVEARRARAREILRGRTGAAPSGANPSASTGQTITMAEVRAAAQKRGASEAEALAAYRQRGFLIVE